MLYRTLLKIWLLPPLLNVIVIVTGLLLMLRYRRLGFVVAMLGVISLLLFSAKPVSTAMLRSIEVSRQIEIERLDSVSILKPGEVSVLTKAAKKTPEQAIEKKVAIVVLGAGHHELSPEYAVAYPNISAIIRLNYAAYLHKKTNLPLLLTGGQPRDSLYAHANVMADYLQLHFGIAPAWREINSHTTHQNALFTREMLFAEGIKTIVLVTQSVHMRRSMLLFTSVGFEVIPAPTELSVSQTNLSIWDWLPSIDALRMSTMVIHEVLGYWWYQLNL